MSNLDMDRKVAVTFDLATLLLFQNATGFAGFHDPILDHLNELDQQALWKGSDMLLAALRAEGIEDWDAAMEQAAEAWNKRDAG